MDIKSRLTKLERLHPFIKRRDLTDEMQAALLEISQALGTDDFDDLHIPPALLEKAEPIAKFISIPPRLICFMIHQVNVFHCSRTGYLIGSNEQLIEAIRGYLQSKNEP